jgi:HAD superfamily hydrolase (TIGR01549 family)
VTRAIIFDMDGALLRLEVDIEEVRLRLAALFAPHGITRPFRPILGRIYAAAAEAAARGADAAALTRAGLELLELWETKGAADARAREGAADVVRALADRGDRLGLYTAVGRAAVDAALAATGIPPAAFASVVTRDDAAPKPDPAGLRLCAGQLGAETTAYVADHASDLQAARGAAIAHLELVGVSSALTPEDKLRAAGATRVITSLRELL